MKTKMSNYSNCFALAYVMLVAVLFVGCSNPKVGETWRWTPRKINENPFKEQKIKRYYDYKVLEVKDDYILYLGLEDSLIDSSTIKVFKILVECISTK